MTQKSTIFKNVQLNLPKTTFSGHVTVLRATKFEQGGLIFFCCIPLYFCLILESSLKKLRSAPVLMQIANKERNFVIFPSEKKFIS